MPNKDSARKALRQAIKRAALNSARRTAFRTATKKTLTATVKADALKAASLAQKAFDKAAKHGTIKKNTAARKISRLMKKVHKMK